MHSCPCRGLQCCTGPCTDGHAPRELKRCSSPPSPACTHVPSADPSPPTPPTSALMLGCSCRVQGQHHGDHDGAQPAGGAGGAAAGGRRRGCPLSRGRGQASAAGRASGCCCCRRCRRRPGAACGWGLAAGCHAWLQGGRTHSSPYLAGMTMVVSPVGSCPPAVCKAGCQPASAGHRWQSAQNIACAGDAGRTCTAEAGAGRGTACE